ncbi:MAG: hypothetical protein JSS81_28670 [Acidobacteria bacterium]|nr:hypothetical protein [Acidobacteriota bacterium]
MKRIFSLLAILPFALAFALVPSVAAQTVRKPPKLIDRAAADKREVERFVRSFVRALDETKDLNSISDDFFVGDFKARFNKQNPASHIETSLYERLDENERYELNTAGFNIEYLGTTFLLGKVDLDKSDETTERDDDLSINALFPASILGLIKNSRTLRACYYEDKDDDDESRVDFEIKDIELLREFIRDSKNLAYAQRMSLNDRSPEQVAKYEKTLKALKKEADWYSSEKCSEDCAGFPENTRIYELRYYPLYLKLIRERNAFRIFDVDIGAVD